MSSESRRTDFTILYMNIPAGLKAPSYFFHFLERAVSKKY
jgi:hypothetical protein